MPDLPELLIQRCTACGAYQYYPRFFCVSCGSKDVSDAPACGRGTLYSYSEVERRVSPDHNPPYVVCLVDLEEGPRLLSTCLVDDLSTLHCGDPVQLGWKRVDDLHWLHAFRVSTSGSNVNAPAAGEEGGCNDGQ